MDTKLVSNRYRRLRIDQLSFTGPTKQPVSVQFGDGVNIIWGASNTGKSFVRKSIDYLFGGEKPTLPPEAIGYDNFLLWITLNDDTKITLRCSALGGDIYKSTGHTYEVTPKSFEYVALKRKHISAENVSKYILKSSGFREAKLLKNERAEKTTFSLRMLMRYLLIDEARMIDDKSVILSHSPKVTSEDKSLVKFLLTGIDGSSVEQVRSGGELKAAHTAQIELLAQMADDLRERIDYSFDEQQLPSILDRFEQERDDIQNLAEHQQATFDELVRNMISLTESLRETENDISDLQAMLYRFEELSRVYKSDVERLQGLEEGGFLLQRFATINCPVCGANQKDQKHDHGLSNVEEQRIAIEAEINKILREASELTQAIDAANTELTTKEHRLKELAENQLDQQVKVDLAKITNSNNRVTFTNSNNRVREVEKELELRQQLKALDDRIESLSEKTIKSRQKAENIGEGVELTQSEAYELSKIIKETLRSWKFPNADDIHYDQKDHDIVVNGKRRKDNGAGIRALLHSAFKVSVLDHSIRNELPHPGFLILDSPLLAYREAEEDDPYGALTDEELLLREAGVASAFYKHLQTFKKHAQFIVIENHKSDQYVVDSFRNEQFTGNSDLGRSGLF